MTTAKITEIWNINEWNWPHGVIYYIPLKLDNGETIRLWKTKKDAFKVGDSVSYEVVEEGKKWKEVKENPFIKKQYGDNGKWAMVGMAIKTAFDLVYKWDDDFQKAAFLAQRIYDLAAEMTNWTGSKSENQTDANKTDEQAKDLPF